MGVVSGKQDEKKIPKTVLDAAQAQVGYTAGFTSAEIIHEMDALYGSAENLRIPLISGAMWVGAKLGGRMTTAELEAALVRMRTGAATTTPK